MVYYAAESFPPEFRSNTFVGNVMTCRINRDSLVPHGSTRIAKEEPDFLNSDDPRACTEIQAAAGGDVALIKKGMSYGDTPRAVCQSADFIFVMVTNSASAGAVCGNAVGNTVVTAHSAARTAVLSGV
jgi:hypothetical protein